MTEHDPFNEPERAHPRARELMSESFFWDCVDEEAPFALARDRVVVLNASHPAVRAALAAAKRNAPVAAATLARLVLLSGARLDEERDLELLSRAAASET